MRFIPVVIIALLLAAGAVPAGESRVIELTDGSTITGEVVSLSKGVYTVRTESLGTMQIEESKVRAIRVKSAATGQVPGNASADIEAVQKKMLGDADIMGMVQSLQNDPEFQKVLADPEIMKAVNAGDIAALTANPKFMQLMNNQTVKDIQKKAAP